MDWVHRFNEISSSNESRPRIGRWTLCNDHQWKLLDMAKFFVESKGIQQGLLEQNSSSEISL